MAQLLSAFDIFSIVSLGWTFSGVLLVILILAICLFKWKKQTINFLKIVGYVILFVVLPIGAVFSAVNVNGYLSAEGGIFGQIKHSLGINKGKVSTDTFEISELNLRLDENGEYSATVKVNIEDSETTIKIDQKKNYVLLINGALTSNNFMSTTGGTIAMSADYTYTFNDFQKDEIIKDTLHIAFMLNKNDIVCRISSEGGAVARNLWSLYYRKNGMKIKFVESDYKKPPISNEGDGDVTNFFVLTFDDGENVISRICPAGAVYEDIPTAKKYGYTFVGWTLDGENLFDFSQIITTSMTFTAKFEEIPVAHKQAGVYSNGILTHSWDEMVEAGAFTINEFGMLSYDRNYTYTNEGVRDGELVLPSEVKSLANSAFWCDTRFKSIDMSLCSEMTIIEDMAFNHSAIETVVFPFNLTEIKKDAFNDCQKLKAIDFKNTELNMIGDYAFYNCILLDAIDFTGTSVTEISSSAFQTCSNLKSVTLGDKVTVIKSQAFRGCNIEMIVIPENITSIGNTAFAENHNLKTVYNLSSLNIVRGSETYGCVAKYASQIYTSL